MSIQSGTYKLGPDNATLRVKTGRDGAAAKAGHDLVIEVTSWGATLEVGEAPGQTSLVLDADAGSLRVLDGSGGIQALSEDDKMDIAKTIDDDVLEGAPIEFRSTGVATSDDGKRLSVSGDLKMAGNSQSVEFDLSAGLEGQISGNTAVKQTDWGMKPYSALFGALKVADEVTVEVEGTLK